MATGARNIGRNDPCICGSGKKYKKCCMNRPREAAADTPLMLREAATRQSAGDFEGARRIYQQILDRSPLNADAAWGMGCLLAATNDKLAAVAYLRCFETNYAMTRFLRWEDTARFYHQVMGLWTAVRSKLVTPVLELRYEDLVVDLESRASEMLDFIGAPWEPRVLEFYRHTASRPIATPSYWAVQQPVYQRSVGRWKNYAERFSAVDHHLQPFLRTFGYETASS